MEPGEDAPTHVDEWATVLAIGTAERSNPDVVCVLLVQMPSGRQFVVALDQDDVEAIMLRGSLRLA